MSERTGGPGPRRDGIAARIWKLVVLVVLWRSGGLRGGSVATGGEGEGAPRQVKASATAELLTVGLLLAASLAALGFAVLMILDPDTQLLALAAGGALALLGFALAVAGAAVVPQVTTVERRPMYERDTTASDEVAERLRAGVDGITRRRLLGAAAGAAGAGLAAAVVAPVVALGPGLTDQLQDGSWRAGRRLVEESGVPIAASAVETGSFLTAFPEGANPELLTSPIVVVRVDPAALALPPTRRDWAPAGILAYSKICTHAACAISLYRSPLSPTTESGGPALVCPCHYSTFDVLDGGSVEFGPAGRPLPQLPLMIDASGDLRAAGPMSGPVGPSWWGDRQ